uniref:ABC transporter ATP-binding protein n=1 Tax=candidate division WOR-3 bacterium TaxID=2052148 RepID=A0A7C3J5R2_UNCW3
MEEERSYKLSDKRILQGIWDYSKKYFWQIIFTFILLLFISGLQVVLPQISRRAIDGYIRKNYSKIIFNDKTKNIFIKNSSYTQKIDSFFLIPSKILTKADLIQLEKDSLIDDLKYFPIEKQFLNEVKNKNIEYFESEKNIFIPENELLKLDRKTLYEVRKQDIFNVRKFALLYVLILLLLFIFNYVQVLILSVVSEKIMFDMREDILKHMLNLSMDFFNRNPIGKLVTRATNDVAALRELFTDVFVYSAKDILTIIGIIVMMVRMSLKLSLIILLTLPFVILILIFFQNFARISYRKVRVAVAKLNAFISESISGVSLIQSFHKEKESFDDFNRIGKEFYDANMNQLFIFSIFRPLIDVISSLTLAVLIYFGSQGIFKGEFTLGILFAFFSYIELFFRPIFDFSEKYNIYQGAMAASEKIFILLDERSSIVESKEPKTLKEFKGEVEFRNVSFEYKKGEPVLKNVSFKIEPNTSAAFVGATGAGKTTIINLLLRFFEPNEGEILIDGVNIKELPLKELRDFFGLVLQDVVIFSGDIKYNILLSRDIPFERMEKYSKYVNADKFIEKLPERYDTLLNERGTNLSTGQRQLIAFARALVGEPKILILDEATSNIDSETEHLIQDAISKIMKDRTTIAIAHRLSTIQDADKIYVLNKGRIVEEGNHKELIAKKNYYWELYKLQYIK